MEKAKVRIEHDLLGEREVSQAWYYGIQTLRARWRITSSPG